METIPIVHAPHCCGLLEPDLISKAGFRAEQLIISEVLDNQIEALRVYAGKEGKRQTIKVTFICNLPPPTAARGAASSETKFGRWAIVYDDNGPGMSIDTLKRWATDNKRPPGNSFQQTDLTEYYVDGFFSKYGTGSKKALFTHGSTVLAITKQEGGPVLALRISAEDFRAKAARGDGEWNNKIWKYPPGTPAQDLQKKDNGNEPAFLRERESSNPHLMAILEECLAREHFTVFVVTDIKEDEGKHVFGDPYPVLGEPNPDNVWWNKSNCPEEFEQTCRLMREMFYFYLGYAKDIPYKHGPLDVTFTFLKVKGKTLTRTDRMLHSPSDMVLSSLDEGDNRRAVSGAYEGLNDRVFRYAAPDWHKLSIKPDALSAAAGFGNMTLVLLYFPFRERELVDEVGWPCTNGWKEIKVYINGRLMPYEFLGLRFLLIDKAVAVNRQDQWLRENKTLAQRVRGFLFLGPQDELVSKTKWSHKVDMQAVLENGTDIHRSTPKYIQDWIEDCSRAYDVMVDLEGWGDNVDLGGKAFSVMKLRSGKTYRAGDEVVVMARRGNDRQPLKTPATLLGFLVVNDSDEDADGRRPRATGLNTCRIMIRREPREIFAEVRPGDTWEVRPANICEGEDVEKEKEDWRKRAPHRLLLKAGTQLEQLYCHKRTARTVVAVVDGNGKEMSKWEDSAQEPQTLKSIISVRRRVFLVTPRPANTRHREREERELPELMMVVKPANGVYDFEGFIPRLPGEYVLKFDLERPEFATCQSLSIDVTATVGEAKDFDVSFHLKPGQDNRLEAYLGNPIQCTATFYDKEGTNGHRNQVASLDAALQVLGVFCQPPLKARVLDGRYAPDFDKETRQLWFSFVLTRLEGSDRAVLKLPMAAQVEVKSFPLGEKKIVNLTVLPGFPVEIHCPTFEAGNYALENHKPVKDIRVEYLDETGSDTLHFPPLTTLTATITRQTGGHMEEDERPADGAPLLKKTWEVTDAKGQVVNAELCELKPDVKFDDDLEALVNGVEAELEIKLRLGPVDPSGTTSTSAAASGNGHASAADRTVLPPKEVTAVYPIRIMPRQAPTTLHLYFDGKPVDAIDEAGVVQLSRDVGETLEGYELRVFSEGGKEGSTAELTLEVDGKKVTGEDLERFQRSGGLPKVHLQGKPGSVGICYVAKDADGWQLQPLAVNVTIRAGEHTKWGLDLPLPPQHRRKSAGGRGPVALWSLAGDSDIIKLPLGVPLAEAPGIRIVALDRYNNEVRAASNASPCLTFLRVDSQQPSQQQQQQRVRFLVSGNNEASGMHPMDEEDGVGMPLVTPPPAGTTRELDRLPPRYLRRSVDGCHFTFSPGVYLVGDADGERSGDRLYIHTVQEVPTDSSDTGSTYASSQGRAPRADMDGPVGSYAVKFAPPKASMGKVTLRVQNLDRGQCVIKSRATLQGLAAELHLSGLPGGRSVVVSSRDSGEARDAITLVLASRTPGLQLVALRQPESGSKGGPGRGHGHGAVGASSSTAPSQDMIQGEVLPGGCARYSFPPLGLIWGGPVDARGTVVQLAVTAQKSGGGNQQAPVALAEETIDLKLEPDPDLVTGIDVLTGPNSPPTSNLQVIATDPLPSIMLSLSCEDGGTKIASAEHKLQLSLELRAPVESCPPENGTPRKPGEARRSLGPAPGTQQATAETEGASSERLVFRFQESKPSLLRKVGTYTLTARWKEASQDASLQPREVVKEIPVTVLPGSYETLVAPGWIENLPYNNLESRVLSKNVTIIAQDRYNNVDTSFQATLAVSLHCKDHLLPEQLAALDGNPLWTFQVVNGQGELPPLSLRQGRGTVDAGYELRVSHAPAAGVSSGHPPPPGSVPPLLRLPFVFHNMAGLDRRVAECKRELQAKQQEMRPLETERDSAEKALRDAELGTTRANLEGRGLLYSHRMRQVLPPVRQDTPIFVQLEQALDYLHGSGDHTPDRMPARGLIQETNDHRRAAVDQVDAKRLQRGIALAGLNPTQRALLQRYQEHLYPLVDLGWVEDDNLANIMARLLSYNLRLVVLKANTPDSVHEELDRAHFRCLKWSYLGEGPMRWTLPHKHANGNDIFTPRGNPRFLASHFVMPETLPPPLKAAIQKALGQVVILDTRENALAYIDRLPRAQWRFFSSVVTEDMRFYCRSSGITSALPGAVNGARLAAAPANPADHPTVRQLDGKLADMEDFRGALQTAVNNIDVCQRTLNELKGRFKKAQDEVNEKTTEVEKAREALRRAEEVVRQRQPAAPACPTTPATPATPAAPGGAAAAARQAARQVMPRVTPETPAPPLVRGGNPRALRKRGAAEINSSGSSDAAMQGPSEARRRLRGSS
eukprot:jgi/Mesvir1/27740/Mv07432-RA.1